MPPEAPGSAGMHPVAESHNGGHPVQEPRPDWSRRADPALLAEWMDQPCSFAEFRACIRDVEMATRLTGGFRPTLRFVREAVRRHPGAQPLHVVDVGSGGGDTLRRLARWAHRQRVPLRLTGIDLNPHATRAAEERFPGSAEFLTGDVLEHPAVQQPDVVISSLVTHHMRDGEVVAFLRWMEEHAAVGWYISDLRRSARAARLFALLAAVMRWHRFVRHDGPVSFRRSFRRDDWEHLLQQAGVAPETVQLDQSAVGRLCVARWRERKSIGTR